MRLDRYEAKSSNGTVDGKRLILCTIPSYLEEYKKIGSQTGVA
jgi:hypothetical protein